MKRFLVAVVVGLLIGVGVISQTGLAAATTSVVMWTRDTPSNRLDNIRNVLDEAGIAFTEVTDSSALASALQTADTFLFADQCDVSYSTMEELGRQWKVSLSNFVSNGGRIVGMVGCMGLKGGAADTVLKAAGLLTNTKAADWISGHTLEVIAPDDPLVEGVSSTFTGESSTIYFKDVDGKVIITEKGKEDHPVVFTKEIGPGLLVMLGFNLRKHNEDMDRLLINAVTRRVILPKVEEIPLDPRAEPPSWELGIARADTVQASIFTWGTIEVVEDGQTKSIRVAREYTVQVPQEGAKLLAVILKSQNGGNLDLYGRAGNKQPVLVPLPWNDVRQVTSDFASISPGGEEILVIANPKPNTKYWFIVENRESFAQNFTIAAFLIPEIRNSQGSVSSSVGVPDNLPSPLARYLQTRQGLIGLQQYRIEVPKGAKRLIVQVEGEGNLNLHIRFGKPVGIKEDGQIEADISAISSGNKKTIVLSGNLLQAGTYYIAVEGLNPPQDFTLTVNLEATSEETQQARIQQAVFV